MDSIINAVRYFIHENKDEVARAELEFVIATKPLYKKVILATLLSFVLVGVGEIVNIHFNDMKKINLLFMAMTVFAIWMIMLSANNVFKVTLAGTVYGVARSGVSGLDGGITFLKQFWAAGFSLIAACVAVFGILSFVDFTWTSATYCTVFAFFVLFSKLATKLGG